MSDNRAFEISTQEEANEALEYFNGFHDGFVKRILILSHDHIDEDFSQTCSGLFDIEIDFAHFNYPPGGQRPFNQLVQARFFMVQDLFWDFQEGYLGNTIITLAIHPVNRRMGGSTTVEQALALHLGRNFYFEHYRRYEYREAQIFTFTKASFRETAVG